MPRKRRPGALDELTRTALVVFARTGFRQAQMADVAREMGVALGTLYSYVESKDALFGLVVDRAFTEGSWTDIELPIPTPAPTDLLERTRLRMEHLTELPRLDAAQRPGQGEQPRAELREVLEEIWDLTLETRLAADMIEKSARDWPELSELFYAKIRRDLFARLQAYLVAQMRLARFRSDGDPAIMARTALETITFWARHRYRDPDGLGPSDTDARQTVLEFLVDGIAGTDQT